MVNAPKFPTFEAMENSNWLQDTTDHFNANEWPSECTRCRETESIGQSSIRRFANAFHEQALRENREYLVVGGVLDNICNSACQSCNAEHSTKIGALSSKDYIRINNETAFHSLPLDRIIQLDINGGEPTASPAYQQLLENLPTNLKYLRVNTNGSRILPNLQNIIGRGIEVTITVSLDGIGKIHDYVRWPIKWDTVDANIQKYKTYNIKLNTWTTVHALNIGNFVAIQDYVKENDLDHSWALLENPDILNVKYSNHFTRQAKVPEELQQLVATDRDNTVELQYWTNNQDTLREIKLWDYFR